jgi:uncharacterized protein YcgI (DUF1989 family)
MPLLMIRPQTGLLPPESDFVVEGGDVKGVKLAAGQLLAVTDLEGGQPAAMFGVLDSDPDLFLSPHHTRVFSNSFALRLGMRLVTNKRRPVMVLGISPPHLAHDLLMPVTEGEQGGAEKLKRRVGSTITQAGGRVTRIADPVNLFLSIGIGCDGSLTPAPVSTRAGDMVALRVVANMTLAVAAPRADPCLWHRAAPGPLRVQVRNELEGIIDLRK